MNVTSLHRFVQIGSQYIGFQSEDGDGLFIRVGSSSRLYYTRQFEAAKLLLSTLFEGGREALENKSSQDEEIHTLWKEMSRLGFFYNHMIPQTFSIVCRVNGEVDIHDQIKAFVEGFSENHHRIFALDIHVSSAETISVAYDSAVHSLSSLHITNPPRIRVISKLAGDKPPSDQLVSCLDSRNLELSYAADISDPFDNPILLHLDQEGFLPSIQFVLSAPDIENTTLIDSVVLSIKNLLAAESNREITLRFIDPPIYDSEYNINRYFDAVEYFYSCLINLDEDISRTSVIQRISLCLLHSRMNDHILQAEIVDQAFRFSHFFDGYPVATIPLNRNDLECFVNDLDSYIKSPNPNPNGTCPEKHYALLSPLDLALALPGFSQAIPHNCGGHIVICRRRSKLWQDLFDWLLSEMLEMSRENIGYGQPLRLDLTPDREAVYSPLYPKI